MIDKRGKTKKKGVDAYDCIYLEFYISAALSIFTIPFSVSKFAKFIPEGTLGHVIIAAIKLAISEMILGFMHTALDGASYTPNSFKSICIFFRNLHYMDDVDY